MYPHGYKEFIPHDPAFYKDLIGALDNNTVLRVKNENGAYIPINCSREFAEMMECTPEEFIEAEMREPLSTVFEADREEAAFLLNNGKAKDGRNHVIIRKRTMKGNIIWVNLHYAFFTHAGKDYAYCNYFDVTQLKENENRMQQMYEELNNELRAISDDSLSVIRSNLTDGIVEEISGRDLYDCDKVGANVEELMKVRLESMPNPSDRQRYIGHFNLGRMMEAYNSGEEIQPLVIFTKRQSGRQCFVKYSAGMRKDPVTGKATVFGIETEYNTEKVNEILNKKILARQYDMISYVVDGSYGVVIGDPSAIRKGSIFPKYMNGEYMEYISKQVIPAAYSEAHNKEKLLHDLDPGTIIQKLGEEESYSVDVTCEIDGEIFYKRFTFYAVDPEVKFYILLKADFTEIQKEQLARNEQLKTALEEARQANIAKTAFLSNMSHEMRTPMNAIIGLDNIALKDSAVSAETREYLEQIGSSARHLLGLINDILDMSRIESGRMIIRSEEFSFRNMLEQINTMISGQCRDKQLKYECIEGGGLNEYYIGDDIKLKQVLINILGNAVKFTPANGAIRFKTECASNYRSKSTLRFTIKDTGIGMDEAYLPKLFEAFTQENSATTSSYGGSGLGMAITKNIVEMMNGSIAVRSEKGKGTEFTVVVTLGNSAREAEEKTEAAAPNDIANGEKAEIKLQGRRILLAEDVEINAKIMKHLLEMKGMAADVAANGEIALEMFKKSADNYYDAILMDIRMPVMDGLDAAAAIRALERGDSKTVPIIAMTANAFYEDVQKSLQAGMNAHLSKPVEPDILFDTLASIINA